jgi:hypothetical protein
LRNRITLVAPSGRAAVAGERAPARGWSRGLTGCAPARPQTVVDLRKEVKACRRAGRERRRAARETESLRVAAPEPFTPDSASSMEQARGRSAHARGSRLEHACSGAAGSGPEPAWAGAGLLDLVCDRRRWLCCAYHWR